MLTKSADPILGVAIIVVGAIAEIGGIVLRREMAIQRRIETGGQSK
jgi:hypothetical protein